MWNGELTHFGAQVLSISNVPCFGIYASGVPDDATMEELIVGFSKYGQLHASLGHQMVRRVGMGTGVMVNYLKYEDARAAVDAGEACKLLVCGCLLTGTHAHKNTEFVDMVLETMDLMDKSTFSLQDVVDEVIDCQPRFAEIEVILKLVPQHIAYDASNRLFSLVDPRHCPSSPVSCGVSHSSPPAPRKSPLILEDKLQEMQKNYDSFWNLFFSDEHLEILRRLFVETWDTTMPSTWVDSDAATAELLRIELGYTDLPKRMLYPVKDWDIPLLCQALHTPSLSNALIARSSVHTAGRTGMAILTDFDVLIDENIISSQDFEDKYKENFYGACWNSSLAVLCIRNVRFIIAHRAGNSHGYSPAVMRCLCGLTLCAFDRLRNTLQDPDAVKLVVMPPVNETPAPRAPLCATSTAFAPSVVCSVYTDKCMSKWDVSEVEDFFKKLQLPAEAIQLGQVDGSTLVGLYKSHGVDLFTKSVVDGGFGLTKIQFKGKLVPNYKKFVSH